MGTRLGTNYLPSTLIQVPSKGNKWYVVVTKPKSLQTSSALRVRKSTGTTDLKIARSKQHDITKAIYAEFDEALKPPPVTLMDLFRQHCPLPANARFTHEELIADTEGGNLWVAMQVWEGSKRNPDVAKQLYDFLEYHEAVNFRDYTLPKVEENPYPKTSIHFTETNTNLDEKNFDATKNLKRSLQNLVDYYVDTRTWSREKSKSAAQRYLLQFCEMPAPRDVNEIKKIHAYKFAQHLHDKGLAQKTIKSAVSAVSAFLTDCEKKGHIDSNPFFNLKLKEYGAVSVGFSPFTKEQLERLFSLEISKEDYLCLAILAGTGMRLDEVALIEGKQIKQHSDGFQYIDLTNSIVKNSGSQRLVPLHPRIKITTSENGRLFSYRIDKDGKAENSASKKLMRIIRNVTDNNRVVVHSLRGNFKDMMREAGITKETNDFITGHGQGDDAGDYGVGPSVRARYDAILKLDLTFIDIERL